MKAKVFCLSASVLTVSAVFADGAHADPVTWFDEDYSGFTETSSTVWTTDAGRWSKADAGDLSVGSAEGIALDTRGRELKFAAREAGAARTSATNAYVRIACRMDFEPYEEGEEYVITNNSPNAAIAMRLTNGVPVFIGWRTTRDTSKVKGYWTQLGAAGFAAETNRLYDVVVESDYSCVPTRVRYSVDGHVLSDAQGTSWFSVGGGVASVKRASSLGFLGHAHVGAIEATEAATRPERATVTFDHFARPRIGDAVTFASIVTNAGCALAGDLSCRWYRTDASGMRSDTVLSTDPNYTLTQDDYGHWVTVEVSDDSGYAGSGRFWFSELPVCYIDVADGAFPSPQKEDHDATLFISGNAEYKSQYNGKMTIHVRGNSTAGQPKRPYKIKLDSKANLFGLCTKLSAKGKEIKSKHWVLLANYFDESLMRNKISYDLSREFGLVPMESTWVDVVINGRFDGCYLLAQQIRVAEERVNVYDWSDAATTIAENAVAANPGLTNDVVDADAVVSTLEDLLETNCLWMTTGTFTYLGTNYTVKTKGTAGVTEDGVTVVWKKFSTDVSGGYIFELDAKKTHGNWMALGSQVPCSFVQTNKTAYGELWLHLAMNTPEYAFTNPDVESAVWDIWYNIGQACLSGTGYDGNGRHYSEICDFDSLVGYWLAEYVPGNLSALSRYSYQDVGGKMVFGPAWDYDYALGSLQVREDTGLVTDDAGQKHYAAANPRTWGHLQDKRNLLGQWTGDPYFSFKLREKYLATRAKIGEIFADGGLIDQYRVKLATSARANDLRWNNRIGFAGTADDEGDVDALKTYLRDHVAWLDEQFADVGTAIAKATTAAVNSKLRFVADTSLAFSFNGVKPNPASIETKIVDKIIVLKRDGVSGTIAAPNAKAVRVGLFVNGLAAGTFDVVSGAAQFVLPRAAFTPGATNFITAVAFDSAGTILSRNAALLYCDRPGFGFILR